MRVRATSAGTLILGSILSFCFPLMLSSAAASAQPSARSRAHAAVSHHAVMAAHRVASHYVAPHHVVVARHEVAHHAIHRIALAPHYVRHAVFHGRLAPTRHVIYRGMSCVPFARRDSGIDLSGNAWEWWDHAKGIYARGHVPQTGAVLAFRANARMRLGHVAVVSRIVNRREVEINQANWWGPGGHYGGVSHNVPVVDVSEANDWTAVRVGLGRPGEFGAVYPTYGFIYDRPDNGVMVAAAHAPAPQPAVNPAPADLRPVADRPWATYEEVAEAPAVPSAKAQHGVDMRVLSGVVGAVDHK